MALSLTIPVYAEELGTVQLDDVKMQSDMAQQEPESITEPVLMQERLKQPVSKKKVAKKFLLAMFGVGISSFIIYAGLTVYNKLREGVIATNSYDLSSDEDKSLDTPENLSEAVRIFVEKTKWK